MDRYFGIHRVPQEPGRPACLLEERTGEERGAGTNPLAPSGSASLLVVAKLEALQRYRGTKATK